MNVLVTGATGFLGSNVVKISNNNFNFLGVTKSNLNLFSTTDIDSFIFKNKIEAVIHCAIEGGHRLEKDDYDIFYKNILMYENLIKFKDRYKIFINIASGAEFDRRNDINLYKEEELYKNIPVDYYGLSKNIISKLHNQFDRGINLRIFNCFYPNERNTRFISSNIKKYINREPMIVHQDRYIDFLFLPDFIKVLEHFLNLPKDLPNDINISYKEKYKLSDILNKINNLNSYKSEIIVENEGLNLSYTGNSSKFEKLNVSLEGIDKGINYCYNYFLK
jgi:nucleoside-diphosphate-sugar epimerase